MIYEHHACKGLGRFIAPVLIFPLPIASH